MKEEDLDACSVKASKVYGRIIMVLLVALQGLGAIIITSAYNNLTALELVDDKHSEEIELLDKDLAVMTSKIAELEQKSDVLEAYIMGRPEVRRGIRIRRDS